MQRFYAVLTGDVVKSAQITTEHYEQVLYQLEQLFLSSKHTMNSHYNIYRGDAFQLLLPAPKDAIKLALLIRLSLKALQTDARISIGIGEISNLRPDVKSATGIAFTLSGRGLDTLLQERRMTIHCQNAELESILALPLRMADHLVNNLTSRQAEALLLYLLPANPLHEKIAIKLGTSRANVTKLLNNSNFDYQLLDAYLDYCHLHLTRIQS